MDLLTVAMLCSPLVNPSTTLGVIAVESAGHPFVIHDNSDGNTYQPATSDQAIQVATLLIGRRHSIDMGLMQINYNAWFRPSGLALANAFDPCMNIRLGTTILSAHYARALGRFDLRADALARALSRYNSGSESRSLDYAHRVLKGRP